jgi:excisionase family DNA binding protein
MGDRLISTTEAAKILGISRQAIFKKIQNGQIKAEKIGRNFVIDKVLLIGSLETPDEARKREITKVAKKIFQEYGEVIRRLGKE